MSRHQLNHAIVRRVAENLIKINGATTTLEVKNRLRNEGFVAFQAEVSKLMEEVACTLGWEFEWNGRFRIYFFRQVQEQVSSWQLPLFSAN